MCLLHQGLRGRQLIDDALAKEGLAVTHTLTSSPGAQSDHLMVTPDQAAPFTKTFAAPAMWSLTVAAARSASPDSIASTMS